MLIYRNEEVTITTNEYGDIVTTYNIHRIKSQKEDSNIDIKKIGGRYWGYIAGDNLDDLVGTLTKELKKAKKLKEKEGKKELKEGKDGKINNKDER
jgi:alpha-galactosidase